MNRPDGNKETAMDAAFLYPWFIGARAENHELFEQVLLEFIHDHVYWRRNFHPDDPPPIPAASVQSADYQAFVARMKQELFALSAALKRSVPLFSPRYMGHMLCDPLMPGLLAQMLTLPYNPNNVSEEAAPVTVGMEIEVGRQLARMVGYNADPARTPCAFGYLTSGGTVANYQALQVLRSVTYYPLALQAALRTLGVVPPAGSPVERVMEGDGASLSNLTVAECLALRDAWAALLRREPDEARRRTMAETVRAARLESLGMHGFFSAHPDCAAPVVLVPDTAHYSWTKAARLLGIGESGLVTVPTRDMRLDPAGLERALAAAHRLGQNVLCVVGVLGSTEYGTLDPVDEIVAARERWARRGLGFAVHVDAAWGGYLATLFRGADGGLLSRRAVAKHFRYFPSQRAYAAFRALPQVDSVTVDPHKLGYLPYGVGGAYLCRDHRCMDFVAHDAPYLGAQVDEASPEQDYERKFRRLGSFILEGSKPGAAAAAAYVTHRTLPLDSENFGRLVRHSVQSCEYFYDRVLALRERVKSRVHVSVPIEPDDNLVVVAFNPAGNEAAAVANAFTGAVFEHLRVGGPVPPQARAFFSSSTMLYRRMLPREDAARILADLGIASYTFTEMPEDPARDADGLLVLRHTLMNPWLRDPVNDVDYIEMYCRYLEELVLRRAAESPVRAARDARTVDCPDSGDHLNRRP